MSLTIAGTADALNRHHVAYAADIQQALKRNNEMEQAMTPVYCEHTYAAPNATIAGAVQPYQKAFTPNVDVDFDAEENTLQPMKVDIEFGADDLDQFFDMWLAWVDQRGMSRKEYTFPRYLIEQVVNPQIIEDLNKVTYNGVYAAPTPGTAGAVLTSVDGLGKKIADAITASKITPIATGILAASTMVQQVETFCDGMPIPYRDTPGEIWMSNTNARLYWRDYRDDFGTGNGVGGNENNQLRIDATNKVIRGFSEMEGSDRFVFVANNGRNILSGFRRGKPIYPIIRWQEDERVLKGLAEFYRFYGFAFAGHMFVNDQA